DPARGMQVISDGDSAMQTTDFTESDSALGLMQLAADSEAGELYTDCAGRVTWRARNDLMTDARSAVPQAVFGDRPGTVHDAGTELPYYQLGRADDDTAMYNDIQATISGSGNMQEAKDAASISKYLFARTYARTDLILSTDTDALQWAYFLLWTAAAEE